MNELSLDKKLIVFLLKILHTSVLIFTLTGWLLPNKLLLIYLVWIPLMVIQWQLNQETCILTNQENYLLGETNKQKSEQQGQFVKSLFLNLCGFVPADNFLKYLIYFTIFSCWSIGGYKFYLYYYGY
ncbi:MULTISPECIES: hypothetical protein [unclassified Okeania]|uniref:hypothetical protein n=1 Tax=unclassified Okeania TaxID=2634635 RepID=UPI0013CA76BB|nr:MULTISPECIES: hypothetical protein [unclassified Okeania]NES76889.1 hypothetical protein [Okeania sp. SIO1H4]NET93685.1 hypothetical protein [Okeania sp. SIO1H2]